MIPLDVFLAYWFRHTRNTGIGMKLEGGQGQEKSTFLFSHLMFITIDAMMACSLGHVTK
jgi:hypothetical protein